MAFLGGLLLLIGVIGFAQGGAASIRHQEPLDLDLNLVAGQRLIHREPLYDQDESRRAAVKMGGPPLEGSYTRPTNGFPGAPTTALVHAPFTLVDHSTGVMAFRLLALMGMLAATAVTVAVLPTGDRGVGALLGVGGLVGSVALFQTLQLGQGHEFVMLGLAAGIWGASKERWGIAGAGLAVATVLKISPVALLIYLLIRGKQRAVASALAVAASLCLGAAAVGRPIDLWIWARDVVPGLSGGVLVSNNQSLPAFLARLFGDANDLGHPYSLGAWRYLAIPLMVGAVLGLARLRRGRRIDPLELGILIVVSLLAGPLTWTHYWTWAVLPVVLLADRRRWLHLPTTHTIVLISALSAALLLLTVMIDEPQSSALQRLGSGPNVLAGLLILGVAMHLLRFQTKATEDVGTARSNVLASASPPAARQHALQGQTQATEAAPGFTET